MFNRAEKILAAVLLVVCGVVGFLGYSSSGKPGVPKKIWFDSAGGDVVFDHAYHGSLAECGDCHHNYDEEEAPDAEMDCRVCHYYGEASKIETADPHPRGVGANCLGCHAQLGEHMTTCSACHLRMGLAFKASGRVNAPLPEYVVFKDEEMPGGGGLGTVVFDHSYHRFFAACADCHHQNDPDNPWAAADEKNCRKCHYQPDLDAEGDPPHENFIGANCLSCHENLGDEMEDCQACHLEEDQDPQDLMTPKKPPPQTVELDTDGGKVTFDHAYHTGQDVGSACADCHHPFMGGEAMKGMEGEKNCRACHYQLEDDVAPYEGEGIHMRYIGNTCTECHGEDDCGVCHEEDES